MSARIGALRKMPIHRRYANAGFLCDLEHRSIHTGSREHHRGRLEQGVEIALRVGAHGPGFVFLVFVVFSFLNCFLSHFSSALTETEQCSI